MDKKLLATLAIGVLGNGILVPTALTMLSIDSGWVLLTSALSILAFWKWGHQPPAAAFAVAAAALFLALGTVWYFRKADTVVAPDPVKSDPFDLCLMLIGVDQDVGSNGLIKSVRIFASLVNRNIEPVQTVLLDHSAFIEGFPAGPEFITAEEGWLYPEQRKAIFTSEPILLGSGVKPGTTLRGQSSFVVRFGPSKDRMTTLTLKHDLVIELASNGNSNVQRTARADSIGECPYRDQYVSREYGFWGQNDPLR